MDLNNQLEVNYELLREMFADSLFLTSKYLCNYQEVTQHTHGHMIRNLESDSKRKLIVMPRGTFKSSIGVVAYTIWLLIKNPNLRIMIDSEKYANSKNFIREIKAKLDTPLVRELFGDPVGPTWGEGEAIVAWRDKPFKEASITASGVEAGKTGQHYDVIIHDDLNTAENSRNEEGCQKVIDHYRLNTSILEPDGTIVVIGTRYSARDVIQYILENECENELS